MKKRYCVLAILMVSICVKAQLVEVVSTSRLPSSLGRYWFPTLSPQGDYLLVSGLGYQGLTRIDLTTYSKEVLSTAPNAGWYPSISTDGRQIAYREVTLRDNRRYTAIKAVDISAPSLRKPQQIIAPSRDVTALTMSKREPVAVVAGKMRVRGSKMHLSDTPATLSVENRLMVLHKNGKSITLAPNGLDKSYFWCSISPNGQKIVYTVASLGTWVCDINGKNPVKLGSLGDPKWLGNDKIVGMNDTDDGHVVTSSTIDVVSVDGKLRQIISNPAVIGQFPAVSADGKKVAFCTTEGEIFITNLK